MSKRSDIKNFNITWSLIYKSLVLTDVSKDKFIKNPRIVLTQSLNQYGRIINNTKAYRRSGGASALSERNLLSDETAWYTLQVHSLAIAKFLYKYQLKTSANPLYTLGKFLDQKPYEVNKGSRLFFYNKHYADMIPNILSFIFSKKLNKDISISYSNGTIGIHLDGQRRGNINLVRNHSVIGLSQLEQDIKTILV